jgi:hypothetical protein
VSLGHIGSGSRSKKPQADATWSYSATTSESPKRSAVLSERAKIKRLTMQKRKRECLAEKAA